MAEFDFIDCDYVCINVGTLDEPLYLFGDTETANKMREREEYHVPTCFDNSEEAENNALAKFEESLIKRDRFIAEHGIWGGCHKAIKFL